MVLDKFKLIIIKKYHSKGKLLLSGEYFVLDGALALAIPCRFGQSMTVETLDETKIICKSWNFQKELWFEAHYNISDFNILYTNNEKVAITFQKMLFYIFNNNKENSLLFNKKNGILIQNHLEFPNEWGLGSSSTLINNLAQWSNTNPYDLLEHTMGGSGYDIACAKANSAIYYQIKNNTPYSEAINFFPDFHESIYFVHLNKKQNSREGIQHYRNTTIQQETIEQISSLSRHMYEAKNLSTFRQIMDRHESLVATTLNLTKVKELYFKDLDASVKSLGAWGGDFVMIATNMKSEDLQNYLYNNNFKTFFKYKEISL